MRSVQAGVAITQRFCHDRKVPLGLRFDTSDVLGLRFARSPLWETMEALRVTREPWRQAYHLSWLRTVDLRALAPAAAVLGPLVPRPGSTPDFLTPIPTGPTTGIDDDLAAVAATPVTQVAQDLEECLRHPRAAPHVLAGVRRLLADPARSLERIVAAQHTCWEQLIRPFWPTIDDLLAADIAHRAAALATGGLGSVLNGLHREVGWADDTLVLSGGHHGTTDHVRGRGLVLIPSVFVWPDVVAITDPPMQPTLFYPARGVGTLWPPAPARDPGALGELVGATRAGLLRALTEEASTSTLARRIGLGLPTTSTHLKVLRENGLVTSRRSGREVLHRCTALGATLAATPTSGTVVG